MSTDAASSNVTDEAKRELAKTYNMEVWHLLGRSDRSPAALELMMHAAHASHRLWLDVGSPINEQRGFYVLSRVYAEAGDGVRALYYAKKCRELSDVLEDALRDFDKAYVLEAEARANAIAGNMDAASTYFVLAMAEGQNIERDKDREIFEQDLRAGNWGAFDLG